MKRKISLILFVSLVIVALLAGITLAVSTTNEAERILTNGNATGATTTPLNEESTIVGETAIQSFVATNVLSAKNVKNSSVFEATQDFTMKGETVNGNVYVAANTIVIEDETINGDVFLAGQRIEIKENVIINGTIFVAGQDVFINGVVQRDAFAAGQNVELGKGSLVGYTAYLAGASVNIKGNITRDANVGCTDLNVESSANIVGKLNYSSENEGNIDKTAKVGEVNYKKVEVKERTAMEIVTDYVMDFAQYFVIVMVVLIFAMKFAPNFLERTMKNVTFGSFGWGLLWTIVIPICILALFIFRVTAVVSWVVLFLYIASLLLANSAACLGIGKQISEAHEKIKLPLAVAIVATLSWIVFQLPFIGGIAGFVMHCLGYGILLRSAVTKKSKEE